MRDSKPAVAAVTLTLAMLTAYLTLLTYKPAPVSSRPRAEISESDAAIIGSQFVPARLWQDPLDAERKAFEPRYSVRTLREQARALNAGQSNAVKVLVVPVEGQPYPEDEEIRRRMRYAVQKAMGFHDYKPSDRGNLGVFMVRWPELVTLEKCHEFRHWLRYVDEVDASDKNVLSVPFEWFEPIAPGKPRSLVLWIREEYIADDPLLRLGALFEAIFSRSRHEVASFNVIGPRSSNTLQRFFESGTDSFICEGELSGFTPKLRVFSCQATVPLKRLQQGLENKIGLAGSNTLVRCITSDDVLIDSLILELENRGLRLKQNKEGAPDGVAIFHESDTEYGRSFARIFREALNVTNEPPRVRAYSFLRGVDGKLPSAREESGPAFREGRTPTRVEKAEADHQLDYIKRMARKLREENNEAKAAGGPAIKAIGIVGSDVYDKLLLLQVLRSELPDLLYFTTDLDARLTHPHENAWARGLIVATAYPLFAATNSSLPDLRDSYQAALFAATGKALTDNFDNVPISATVWEIGRSKLIRLLPPLPGELPSGASTNTKMARFWGMSVVMLVSLVGVYLAANWWVRKALGESNDIKRDKKLEDQLMEKAKREQKKWDANAFGRAQSSEARKARKALFLAIRLGFGFTAIVFLVSLLISQRPGEEPFDPSLLFQGAIVWPTEWIRAFLIVFCVTSIIWAYWTYRMGLYTAIKDYHFKLFPLRPPKRDAAASKTLIEKLMEFRATASISGWPHSSEKDVKAEVWLMEYQQRGHLRARLARVLCFGILFGGCFWGLIAWDGFPSTPARGKWTLIMDRALLIAMIVSLIALMSYVVDVIRLTARLIGRLGDGTTLWPEEALEEKSKETGVDAKHLGGLMDVEFVANHTSRVNVATILPFIALALSGFSRANVFDRWAWPPGLQLTFVAYGVTALACAWTVRAAAKKVRDDAINRLQSAYLKSMETTPQKRFETLMSQIEHKRGGAYNQWWADPAIVGILIPPGSAGAFNLIKNLFLS